MILIFSDDYRLTQKSPYPCRVKADFLPNLGHFYREGKANPEFKAEP